MQDGGELASGWRLSVLWSAACLPEGQMLREKCQPTKAQLLRDEEGCSLSLVRNTEQEAERSLVVPAPSSAGIRVSV